MFTIREDVAKLAQRSADGIFQFRQMLEDITPVNHLDTLVREITDLLKEKDYSGHGLVISIDKLIYNGYGNILVFSKKGFFIGAVPYFIYSPDHNQEIMVSVKESVKRTVKSTAELQAVLLEPFFRAFLNKSNKTKMLAVVDAITQRHNLSSSSISCNDDSINTITLKYDSNSVIFSAVDSNGGIVMRYNLHVC